MAGTKKEVAKKVANKTGKVAKTVTGSDDGKALFFLILASCCLYLILDVFYGDNKLLSLAKNIFGISSDNSNIVNNPDDLPQSSIKDALTVDKTGQATGNDNTISGTDGFGGSGGTHNSNGAGAGISGTNSKLTTDGKNGAGLATGATKN